MSEANETYQREVWDSIYKVLTGTLELMVKSAPDDEEARRRIAIVRLDLAVCEGALPRQQEVMQDPDAGTVLVALPQVTTVEDLVKRWTRDDGLIECPSFDCGAPLASSDISETGVCRHCCEAHAVLLAYRQGRTAGKHRGEGT